MSGGSYNYLCFSNTENISSKIDDLRNMVDRIEKLGYPRIAEDTDKTIALITDFEEKLQNSIDKLHKVWHAVEWLDSGDYSYDQAIKELEAYRTENLL